MKQLIALILLAGFLTGCMTDPRLRTDIKYIGRRGADQERQPGPQWQRMNFDNVSYWDGDAASGPARIRISLGQQKAFFYKGDQLVGVSILSTGREGFDTPSGQFKIIQKDLDHVSSKYGNYVDKNTNEIIQRDIDRTKDPMPPGAKYDGALMPYFMRIHDGVGMHEGFLPGYPASHGCIRMPGFMARTFFENVKVGTPVSVEH